MSYEAYCVTNHESGRGEVEITWVVPFVWSPIIPATYHAPEEGGAELDGEVYPCEVTYYPELGEPLTIDRIQDGSILATLILAKYGPPSEGRMFDAIADHFER